MNKYIYLEVWFDSEKDNIWKITLWFIDSKDFDPLESDHKTLSKTFTHIHSAVKFQQNLGFIFKERGYKVYMNNYNIKSYFWIRPAWLEIMISNRALGKEDD